MSNPADLRAKLEEVTAALEEEFKGRGAVDRLALFKASMATTTMHMEHLFDEAERMEGYRE